MFDNPRQGHEFDTDEALSDLLPGRIWLGMISCYALFLASMIAALGSGGKAMLSIAVSIAPAAVAFFGITTFVIKLPTGNPA